MSMRLLHSPFRVLVLGLSLAASILVSCDARPARNERGPANTFFSSCVGREGGSRWIPTRNDRYIATVSTRNPELTAVAGIAEEEGRVFVYDGPAARIHAFSRDLGWLYSFGREGEGPGELNATSDRSRQHGLGWRWLTAQGNAVIVYDGRTLNMFSLDGQFLRRLFRAGSVKGLWAGSRRIATGSALLYYGNGGHDFSSQVYSPDSPTFSVHAIRDGRVMPFLALRLTSLPRLRDGATFSGPREARPLWDARGDCLVASDGGSPSLVKVSVSGGQTDTLVMSLPKWNPPKHRRNQDVAAYIGEQLPRPSTPRRFEALALDPDGYVWLLPVSPPNANSFSVYIVSLASGQIDTATVPAFPREFSVPGSYYSVVMDTFDVQTVVKYRLGPQQNP